MRYTFSLTRLEKTKSLTTHTFDEALGSTHFCSAGGNAKLDISLGGKFANLFWRSLARYRPSNRISNNLTQWYTGKNTKRYTRLFITTQFVKLNNLEETQMSIKEEWLKKPRYSHTMEHKAAIKRNEDYLYTILEWSSSKSLSEKGHCKKVCIIRKEDKDMNAYKYLLN